MNHPYIVAELKSVHDAIGVAALLDRQFPDSHPQSGEWLGYVRRSTIDNHRQRIQCPIDGTRWKRFKILPRRLYP